MNKEKKGLQISILNLILIFIISVNVMCSIATAQTMNQPKMCIPGAEESRGQSIYKCNPGGTGWELNTTCECGSIPGLNDAGTNLECVELIAVVPPSIPVFNSFYVFCIFIVLAIIIKTKTK